MTFRRLLRAPLGLSLESCRTRVDRRADAGHAGGITSPNWPARTRGSDGEQLEEVAWEKLCMGSSALAVATVTLTGVRGWKKLWIHGKNKSNRYRQPGSGVRPEGLIIRKVIIHEMSLAAKYLFLNTFPCCPLQSSFQVNSYWQTIQLLEIRSNDNQWNKLHIVGFKSRTTCTELKQIYRHVNKLLKDLSLICIRPIHAPELCFFCIFIIF